MCRARRRGPRVPSRTTDANLDCAFVENALLFVVLKIGKTRQKHQPLWKSKDEIASVPLPAGFNSPAWLSLYLSVCKLLDLALALPAQALPQFQMYRWAFVREGGPPQDPANDNNNLVQTAAVVSNGGSRCALTNSQTWKKTQTSREKLKTQGKN